MVEILGGALATIILGLIGWNANTLLEVTRTIAVHAEKHDRHDKRFERIEEKLY